MDSVDSGSTGLPGGPRNMVPDSLMMNNNYLPGISPYNGMTGTMGVQLNRPSVRTNGTNTNNSVSMLTEAANTAHLGTNIGQQACPLQYDQQGIGALAESEAAAMRGTQMGPSISGHGYCAGPSFTFTTPTQSYLYSPALVSQPRFQDPRMISHSFAPTGFTQWQHSVPQRLPWTSVGMTTQSGISVFTGSSSQCTMLESSSSGQPSCLWTTAMSDPVASCSKQPRRPKRRSSDNVQYLGPTTKIHLTEEKFAQHMEGLSIQCWATPPDGSAALSGSTPWGNDGEQLGQPVQGNNWKTFQELEDRLEVSDDEEEASQGRAQNTVKTQPVIHMVKDIDQLISKQQKVLPKDILQEIQRPRMELMLWMPPGDAGKAALPSCHTTTTATAADDTVNRANNDSVHDSMAMMDDDDCMDTEPSDSFEL